jgi:hypothetical protein
MPMTTDMRRVHGQQKPSQLIQTGLKTVGQTWRDCCSALPKSKVVSRSIFY